MLLKICGMRKQADIDAACAAGFDFCGFIFHPASPRHIDPEAASRLKTGAMRRVGVFVDTPVAVIARIMKIARLDYAQLHGAQDQRYLQALGSQNVIYALWPQRYRNIEDLRDDAEKHGCAYYLLDAGQSGGGSGNALDWRALTALALPSPWLLAGGLNEKNAAQAAHACSPGGLDFNSGIEDGPGIKNHAKIFAAARAAL